MPRNAHGKPLDLYPEILQRLRQEIAAKTAVEQPIDARAYVAETQHKVQPSSVSSQNPNSQHISQQKSKDKKEKLAMPATVTTHAKAALRSKSRTKRTTASASHGNSESSFEHHRRKCTICHHPDREAIEELFINWHSPQSIRGLFAIYHPFDWSAVYRHARAAGLYAKRSKNLRAVLDLLLEGATHVKPTAHGVIAAVRAYSCLTEEHQWVEPERRTHIVNEVYRYDAPAAAAAQTAPATTTATLPDRHQLASKTAPSSPPVGDGSGRVGSSLVTSHSPLLSNRQPMELESPLTRT